MSNLGTIVVFLLGLFFGALGMHVIWLRMLLKDSVRTLNRVERKTLETEVVAEGLQRKILAHSLLLERLHGRDVYVSYPPSN